MLQLSRAKPGNPASVLYVNNMYIYMFNTTYAKLDIKLSYLFLFSLNQVLLTALDTFFFGDLLLTY